MATAGVQLTLMSLPVFTAVTLEGPGGPDCNGPFGHPPIPGPPGSPFSAIVKP